MSVFIAIIVGVLGAIIASFVGVVAERVYTGQSWSRDRSRCDSCAAPLGPLDLVPVLSWLSQKGRCRLCGARVSVAHSVRELTFALLFVLGYLTLGLSWLFFLYILLVGVLGFIVIYDLRHTVIPPPASLALVLISLVYAVCAAGTTGAFGGALLGAGLVGGAFFLLYALSRGRAMGLGDAPVAFALALFASPYAFSGLLFSFWIGAIVGVLILLLRRGGPRMGIEVPFAPFLAIGFLLAYFVQWNPLVVIL